MFERRAGMGCAETRSCTTRCCARIINMQDKLRQSSTRSKPVATELFHLNALSVDVAYAHIFNVLAQKICEAQRVLSCLVQNFLKENGKELALGLTR